MFKILVLRGLHKHVIQNLEDRFAQQSHCIRHAAFRGLHSLLGVVAWGRRVGRQIQHNSWCWKRVNRCTVETCQEMQSRKFCAK